MGKSPADDEIVQECRESHRLQAVADFGFAFSCLSSAMRSAPVPVAKAWRRYYAEQTVILGYTGERSTPRTG